MRTKLSNGLVADWSATEVRIYSAITYGYRELLVWAELYERWPAWGTAKVTDWQAYTYRPDHTIALVGSHDLATPETIEQWLVSLIPVES